MASIAVLHTGISSNCGQCHGTPAGALTFYNNNDNPKSAVLSPVHIPYTSGTDCLSCHTANYVSGGFGPMNMTQAKHSWVSTTCVTCHEAGKSFYMGAANPALQGRPSDHNSGQMAAPNDCSICHTTANWNSNTLPSGHMPNPGNQGCTVCHTGAPNNYATLAANPVLHTGISSGCITCHGPPTGSLTFYNNFTPKSAVLSPVHIPTGNTPCESCHSSTVFTAFSGATMTSAEHTSMFAYIGNTCDACHNKVTPALSFYGVTNLQVRPNDHNSGSKLTADCSQCHNPNNWNGGAQTRPAKSSTTPTAVAKAIAHGTAVPVRTPLISGFGAAATPAPTAASATAALVPGAATGAGAGAVPGAGAGAGVVAHMNLSASCESCHNGSIAVGKGAQHIPSNNSCRNCHTTNAWLPARFDHQGISARCASCHNGITTAGKTLRHIPTTLDCSSCHGTLAWRPARFTHTGAVGNCQSCHNVATGLGKPPGHPLTTLDCDACHSSLSWLPATSGPRSVPVPRTSAPAPGSRR
jgi:hypothetical protein